MSTRTDRPFAVFDIDGTLIRWQLYHAVVDSLAKDGRITEEEFTSIHDARMQWKQRTHETSFKDYELAVIEAFTAAAKRMSNEPFFDSVHKVFEEYKDQTYTYTRDLVRSLKAKGYLLFAISTSQAEVVEMLAKYYGFDDWGGSIYEYENGAYTGQLYLLKGEEKARYLQKLVRKYGATTDGSIGVGDSEGDIPMLAATENPIAFNPNKVLFEHAKSQGWKIVVERKNMTYELEQRNGKYSLLA